MQQSPQHVAEFYRRPAFNATVATITAALWAQILTHKCIFKKSSER